MWKEWLQGLAGTFVFLTSSVHASGLLVPPVSCSRPTKACSDPARAAAPRICSQTASTPVTWTSRRRYKDPFQFQISIVALYVGVLGLFSPRENDQEGLTLFRSVIWRRKSQSWRVTVWPTVTLNPSSSRRTHTWSTGKRTLSNLIIVPDEYA